MRVAVVGAGSWGTTVAHLARNSIVCKLAEANGVYTPIADQMRACVEEGEKSLSLKGLSCRLSRVPCVGARRRVWGVCAADSATVVCGLCSNTAMTYVRSI